MRRCARDAARAATALVLALALPAAAFSDEPAIRAFLESDGGAKLAGVVDIGGPWKGYAFEGAQGAATSCAEFPFKGGAFAVVLDGGSGFYHFSRIRVLAGGKVAFSMPVGGDYQQCRVLAGPESVQIEVYSASGAAGSLDLHLAVINSFDGASFKEAFAEHYFACSGPDGGWADYKLMRRKAEGPVVRYEAWRGRKRLDDPDTLIGLLIENEAFDVSFLGDAGAKLEMIYTLSPPSPR